jgi:hypothetical protein
MAGRLRRSGRSSTPVAACLQFRDFATGLEEKNVVVLYARERSRALDERRRESNAQRMSFDLRHQNPIPSEAFVPDPR